MAPRDIIIEINDLAMRASDDRLSPEQQQRLNELLESNEDARRALGKDLPEPRMKRRDLRQREPRRL